MSQPPTPPGTIFRSRAPLRLSFAGGGTDVPPYPALRGGAVLSGTITRYAYASLQVRDGRSARIESVDLGQTVDVEDEKSLAFDGTIDLAKAVIRRVAREAVLEKRTSLLLHTDAPPGSGLGSSSAAIVAMLGAFGAWQGTQRSAEELANLAWSIERQDLKIPGGYQDQYASTYGGFNFITIDSDAVHVHPLEVDPDFVQELGYRLVLCFTGNVDRHTGIIEDQADRVAAGARDVLTALDEQKALALEMRAAFRAGDLDGIGELLDRAWQVKKRFSPRISNSTLDRIYDGARAAGALGGKVTGAGGGGHMVFYCHPERRGDILRYLAAHHFPLVPFAFEPKGLQTWRVNAWEPRKRSGST